MIKQRKKWVLVADGARGRIFSRTPAGLENAMGYDFIGENLRDSAVGRSEPGRDFESAYPGRHAYQPRTDWHQHQKELFAQELCDVLEKSDQNKEFDELILICPPKTLGEMRAHLPKSVLAKVTAEFPKDITKFTEHELLDFLEREI